MNKKKIITLCLVVCLIVTAVAGVSLAYFTDTKSAENTFTLGNVKIELIESTLHRENAGITNGTEEKNIESVTTRRLWSADDKLGTGKDATARPYQSAETYYTDQQIRDHATTFENVQLLPGQYCHKMPYVKNTGENDAYVRIRVMIPAAADDETIDSMFTSTATSSGEFEPGLDNDGNLNPNWPTNRYTTEDGSYNIYEYVRVKPLAPGEMTYWNVWGYVGIYAKATEAKMEETGIADGFTVLVEADAIQAAGFENAEDAWTAFDAQKAANP